MIVVIMIVCFMLLFQGVFIDKKSVRQLQTKGNDMTDIFTAERDALNRLINIAKKDTGQSRRVADFLLSWWNAQSCGGFDLTDLWAVDEQIEQDMMDVIRLISRCRSYPDSLLEGKYKSEFEILISLWRPKLVK